MGSNVLLLPLLGNGDGSLAVCNFVVFFPPGRGLTVDGRQPFHEAKVDKFKPHTFNTLGSGSKQVTRAVIECHTRAGKRVVIL